MLRSAWFTVLVVATCATIGLLSPAAQAGTILKLSLGTDVPADIEFTGGIGGTLRTVDDGVAGTTGDQNTAIDFTDFLDGSFADVLSSTASFSMNNLVATGAPTTFGPLVIQNFSGGTLNLYDASNALLLSGTLTNSALTGPIGPPATGALFTTTFAAITGGTLQPLLLPNTLTLSMSLTDINNGTGFTVSGAAAPLLDAFRADVTMNIAALPIPEPVAAVLLLLGGGLSLAALRKPRGI